MREFKILLKSEIIVIMDAENINDAKEKVKNDLTHFTSGVMSGCVVVGGEEIEDECYHPQPPY